MDDYNDSTEPMEVPPAGQQPGTQANIQEKGKAVFDRAHPKKKRDEANQYQRSHSYSNLSNSRSRSRSRSGSVDSNEENGHGKTEEKKNVLFKWCSAKCNDKNGQKNKKSLAHYFNTMVVTFIMLILAATAVLFIWSNQSDGAKVRLTVVPLFSSAAQDTYSSNATVPSFSSKELFNSNARIRIHEAKLTQKLEELKTFQEVLNSYRMLKMSKELALPYPIPEELSSLEYDAIIFKFSLVSSIHDFWASKAYALAILICVFSGIWPYVKLLLLTLCWLQPMSFNTRENILTFLDQLGKFSFIDVFVTVFMMVSFYVNLIKTAGSVGLQVKVQVEPDIGLMTFALGTILSQLYSHVFLYLDERYARPHYLKTYKKQLVAPDADDVIKSSAPAVASVPVAGATAASDSSFSPDVGDGGKAPLLDSHDTDVQGALDYEVNMIKNMDTGSGGTGLELQKKRRLSTGDSIDMFFDRSFLRESRFEASKHPWNERILPFAYRYMPKSLFGVGVRSAFLVAMLFNCWTTYNSIITAPVQYNIEGLTGWALGSDAHRAYTTWDVLLKMAACTDYKTNAYLLGIVYFITVMFMPACTTIICLLVWWFPSNYYIHRVFSHCVLPFMAWSSMDVFTVASMAAAVELSEVSEWIINQNFATACGPQGFVTELTHQQCFSVQGEITWGCYLVGGTSVCLWAIAIYTVVQMNRAQREVERKQPKHHRPAVWRV